MQRSPVRFALALFALSVASMIGAVGPASAQYFGQNKVQYEQFDFRSFETDQFEIYFYPEEQQAVEDAARMAERWYDRHSRTFLREFQKKKPLIFYANSPDFQQTNAVRGQLGQGTGGVTESIKERVIMPLTGSYGETDHVLGHELVHSFQYDIALRKNNEGFSLRNMPLWFIEGMAEYLSIGRQDSHTAMWMRDAAVRGDLPTIRQLTRDQQSYFPYRYGQAYMAYIGGKYGDATVTDLYKMSGRVGLDSAFVYTLGITADSLSEEWKQSTRDAFLPATDGRTPVDSVGTAVIGDPGADNQLNISPAVSPDGRYVAFISRRNLFNTNLFVADAETGEIVQELEGTRSNPHFDALRFINSAGAWSPDGRRFAFITFADGRNEINTFNVQTGEIQTRTAVENVGAIHNLAWSPDGQSIAFSGLEGGLSDLYVYDLDQKNVRQLTNDRYAALQPTWSPDGETLAFTTDRGRDGTNFETLEYGEERIGLIDVESGEIRTIRPFSTGMQHNPQFSPDGRSIYFVADQDGFKDVYRYDLDEEATYRVTELKTGVSGITALSPALSVARRSGRMMFSVFSNGGYSIVGLSPEETKGERMTPKEEAPNTAALLPPVQPKGDGLVGSYLEDPTTGLTDVDTTQTTKASNRLRLDRIVPPSVGASVGGPVGTQVAGGIGFMFSDILGHRNLSVFVQANGTIKDIGGGVFYSNQENRFNYGVGISHQPSAFGRVGRIGNQFVQVINRIYRTQVGAQTSYPFSQTNRLELGVGGTRYGFSQTVRAFNRFGQSQEIDAGTVRDPIYFARTSLAYVGDFSRSGLTSPLQGGRYRFQVTPQFGSRNFVSVLADYRRYFYREPVTLAVRGLHRGNYGANEFDGQLTDNFVRETLGDPYQAGFVRGYSFNSLLEEPNCRANLESCRVGRLYGTRMALGSVELRLPLLGPEVLSLATFEYLPTDLVAFADAGVTWTNEDLTDLSFSSSTIGTGATGRLGTGSTERTVAAQPVTSAGLSARVNVLGAIVMEAFYARTFQRTKNWDFGVILRPGW
ncbi:basic secretory protein-like protein [Salinibacter ruber]|uniref:basic secretory protein-like protein n=1 Tax=Salinibacter ruber TaxID=146919 RepID=UPI0021684EAB|nr:basic secretory protein-like protein [Salinibacter ruber]MCS4198798.1 Tol biopolymer transport system component [Salinibacter ruber]